MAEATRAQKAEAEEILQLPKNLAAARERRYEVKDILNTNLLSPEARVAYEKHYAEIGDVLEKAASKADR